MGKDTNTVNRFNRWTATLALALAAGAAGAVVAQTTGPAAPGAPAATAAAATDTVVVDQKTDDTIKGALRYLASKQTPTGAWTSPGGEHPIAVTGYTVMSYMATGNLPGEGEYGKIVNNGVNFLLSCARPDGYITSAEFVHAGRKGSNMYDHGIATIALAEVYGQTQDPKVREKLAQSIKLIISCQNQEGGWRYTPRPESADMSVTVLQVVALRAAKNSGLDVPQKTIDGAVQYVRSCYDQRSGGFTYQPRNNAPGFARTAAAIYSLQVCGQYDDPKVKTGSEYLLAHNTPQGEYYTYGQFYASPAQYMVGGATWKKWYEGVKSLLLSNAISSGGDKPIVYWEPLDNQGKGVGPVYSTAIYTTILAMPYHYVPLYQR